ncbi:multiple epidermal growth factor-like domains protein 10 isoform X2 [Haliotis rubra]|uniref:multiple epidermal growth factor-like domains protein 10 isoform X2 n=1 Tax=Haliotis rubra TaxID=36100 RepID=UPI001EE59C48|nr:multiple epidermal growth factor-like domains protein 10 isoform X2 [Haliotis rubra]
MYNLIVICFLLLQCMTAYGCRRGRYSNGDECKSCGAGCRDGTCNSDGHCTCKSQWTGRGCTTRCTNGYVQGYSCIRCGSGCQGGRCDADDGTCRCNPGWAGSRCTTRCTNGYVQGYRCIRCGSGCQRGRCDADDGECRCNPGWIGNRCTTRCSDGFYVYGRMCIRCSSRCSGRCNVADGTCRCRTGWAGRRCTIKMAISDEIATKASSTTATNVTESTKADTLSTTGTQTPTSWSSTDLTTQTPTNRSTTDLKPDGEQVTKEEKTTWTYVLIYSLTPVVIISCTILVLCLVLKRRRPRKTSVKTSGAKVPSTADDLASDQAVHFTAVSEGDDDRHYDAIQDPVTQVDAGHDDEADTVPEENVYEIPSDNECAKVYGNISESNDGNLYETPSVNMDRHIYEGLKTRTKISKK